MTHLVIWVIRIQVMAWNLSSVGFSEEFDIIKDVSRLLDVAGVLELEVGQVQVRGLHTEHLRHWHKHSVRKTPYMTGIVWSCPCFCYTEVFNSSAKFPVLSVRPG